MNSSDCTPDDIHLSGSSIASIGTAFYVPPAGLMLDAGWCCSEMIHSAEYLFISHLHPDHWSALIHILFQRYLMKYPIKLIIPQFDLPEWENLLKALTESTGLVYPYCIIPLQPGLPIPLLSHYRLAGYVMQHSKPAMGVIVNKDDQLFVGYTSDTTWEGVWQNPDFFETTILLMECTFMEPCRLPDAILHQHIHLSQISDHFSCFHNQRIYLVHLDQSYQADDSKHWMDYYFSPAQQSRIRIWKL